MLLFAQQFGHAKCQVDTLTCVEPGIAHGLVAEAQLVIGEFFRSAEALGHVVAGQLNVNATRPGSQPVVNLEEPADFLLDRAEMSGLAT